MVTDPAGQRVTLYADALTRAIEEGDAQIRAVLHVAQQVGLTIEERRAAHCMVAASMLLAVAGRGAVGTEEAARIRRAFAMLELAGWSPA